MIQYTRFAGSNMVRRFLTFFHILNQLHQGRTAIWAKRAKPPLESVQPSLENFQPNHENFQEAQSKPKNSKRI